MELAAEVELHELGMSSRKRFDPMFDPVSVFSISSASASISSLALRHHADHDCGASVADHLVRLFGGLFAADGLEGEVGALVRERTRRCDGILDRGVDDMGGTEVASSGEFLTADIDGNDRSRTGDRRTVDCGQADAAAPMTTTDAPTGIRAVLTTAPKPVITAQPIRAPRSSGMSGRTFTQARSCTSIASA